MFTAWVLKLTLCHRLDLDYGVPQAGSGPGHGVSVASAAAVGQAVTSQVDMGRAEVRKQ